MLSLDEGFDVSILLLPFVELRRVFRLDFSHIFWFFFLRYSVIIPRSFLLSSSYDLNSVTSPSSTRFISSFFYISLTRFSLTFWNLEVSCFCAIYIYSIFFCMFLKTIDWLHWAKFWLDKDCIESSCSTFESFLVLEPSLTFYFLKDYGLEFTEIELIKLSIIIL